MTWSLLENLVRNKLVIICEFISNQCGLIKSKPSWSVRIGKAEEKLPIISSFGFSAPVWNWRETARINTL